jgi:hypothetical protein
MVKMIHLGKRISLALLWTLLVNPLMAQERRDSIADLDALAAQHSWRELGDHLTDIAPATRDAHWQKLVEQAALGEVTQLASGSAAYGDKLAVLERYYPAFPSLAQSTAFMKLRSGIGLDAFRRCFTLASERSMDAAACRDRLVEFVRVEPVDLGLAKSAAELVTQRDDDAGAADFYAIELAAGENVCAAPDVAKATVAALGESAETGEAKAGKALLERCFDQLKDAVLDRFAVVRPSGPYMRNTCPTLLAHNLVSGLRAAHCKDLGGG